MSHTDEIMTDSTVLEKGNVNLQYLRVQYRTVYPQTLFQPSSSSGKYTVGLGQDGMAYTGTPYR